MACFDDLLTPIVSAEDAYDGSGSGSGAGDDDDDDPNGGSGLGTYDYPARVPDHTDHTTTTGGGGSTATGGSSTITQRTPTHFKPNSGGGAPPALVPSSTDAYDELDNEVDGRKSNAAPSARFGSGLSLRQAMLTYLFPIYVAWFGGVLCDLF